MRIGLEEVLDIVSNKTGISKKDITFYASFNTIQIDIGRNYDKEDAKMLCVHNFDKNASLGLYFGICAKGYDIFNFFASDIEPCTNDIYEFMQVKTEQGCIGPGFYTNCPYLVINDKCDKKDIKKFIKAVSFDPDKTDVVDCVIDSLEHEKFIESLPTDAISESFFNDIKAAKLLEIKTREQLNDEQSL